MTLVYGDLHIHLGRTAKGKPVKITASPRLTLENLGPAARDKGLQLLGLVDAVSTGVLHDLEALKKRGRLQEVPGGGSLLDGVTIFLGSEVELAHKGKAAHFLAFFPTLEAAAAYSKELSPYLTNPSLSTQRLRLGGDAWLEIVLKHGGAALAAHAFTPHKGVYGNCVHRLGDMFTNAHLLAGLELGLSANTELAQRISDTHAYPYLANSDAHSLGTIGREFTLYRLPELSFRAWQKALEERGTGIVATYGLDPRLGKYYRSFCPNCKLLASQDRAVVTCPQCFGAVTKGVWDRIQEIADVEEEGENRPPYRAHVPLTMLPGVGPATYRRLLGSLGSEIEILHELPLERIAAVGGEKLSHYIRELRSGKLSIQPGGGGVYGKVQ